LVIPVYDEEEVIAQVLGEIQEFLLSHPLNLELLLVDDGSRDGTARLASHLLADWPHARMVRLPHHVGQAAALYYGMQQARGRIVILMDGDGQNDPWDIPQLLALLAQADMVVGVRVARKDSWLRRAASRIANGMRRRILNDGASDTGCGLKAFHCYVIDAFIPFQTLYSFMPALAVGAGFTVTEVPVRHRPRRGGKSKYGVRQFLWRPLLDMVGVWWFTRRRCPLPHLSRVPRVPTCSPRALSRPSAESGDESSGSGK
jgi:glycosyltransferase involved in cell wall biosynthesis